MKAFFIHIPAGEPDLLCLKAVNALVKADLVLSEEEMLDDVREFIPAGCRIFNSLSAACEFLGKLDKAKPFNLVRISPQDAIVAENVLEEMHFFSGYGFETEIIPGVSYINAAAAAHRFPLTRRGVNQSFWVTDCRYRAHSVKLHREIQIAASSTATLVLLNAGEKSGELLEMVRRVCGDETSIRIVKKHDMILVARCREKALSRQLQTCFPAGEYAGLQPLPIRSYAVVTTLP